VSGHHSRQRSIAAMAPASSPNRGDDESPGRPTRLGRARDERSSHDVLSSPPTSVARGGNDRRCRISRRPPGAQAQSREADQEARLEQLETQPAPAAPAAAADLVTKLKELSGLVDSGALTKDEFETAKHKLLAS
jgi:hypothetical protein